MLTLLLTIATAAPVDDVVAQALASSPQLQALEARADAAGEATAGARALPDPVVSAGAFVQSVETRVGPQRARVGVQQSLPFPTRLIQGGRAAVARAEAASHHTESARRDLEAAVRQAYWALWEVRTARALHAEHLTILDGLAATVRARLEVGEASLADLQQVDLTRARVDDDLAAHDARETQHLARLEALVGDTLGDVATEQPPTVAAVDDAPSIEAHPLLAASEARTRAADHQARSQGASRLPDLTVGADWIVTDPAPIDLPDSGKDAVVVGVGLRVPLWQGTYGHDIAAAQFREAAERADGQAIADALQGEAQRWVAEVNDTARVVEVVDATLLPQADAAYASVLGEYAVGRAQAAQTLLAQRDLLELGLRGVRARARHAHARAALAALVGAAP